MKIIYLCESEPNVRRVFGTSERVYNKSEVLANPAAFQNTEYIFSTWGMTRFEEEEIAACLPSLKAVFYAAGTVQGFARPFLASGVRVFSAAAANAVPVAEYTVAQTVLACKGFFKTMRYTDAALAGKELNNYHGTYGVKVGIIGAGMIGSLVARMLKDYGVEVLVYDPFLSDDAAAELSAKKVSLETLFAECFVVSNHLANNEQTKGILKAEHFEKMLPYATFLNTGRGAQVVEKDLIATLKARPDLTAVLDVTDPEPPLLGSEFYTLPNCILTPHIAGSIGNEVQRMGEYMYKEYECLTSGKPCKYEVTLEMLRTMA